MKHHNSKHNLSSHPLYKLYYGIKFRCYLPHRKAYKYYGGRGIIMCEEWKNDFLSFYDWAINNGYNSGLQIDRINVDGNYTPENCRFVTKKENLNNMRTNKYITYNGETKTMAQWAEFFNFPYKLLHQRLKRDKLDFETAIKKPLRIWN